MAVAELHVGAKQDIQEAVLWYEDQRPELGEKALISELERCLELIASAPGRWPVMTGLSRAQPRVRRMVMRRFPYVLPYVVRDDTALVVAVAHTSRAPAYWLPRLD